MGSSSGSAKAGSLRPSQVLLRGLGVAALSAGAAVATVVVVVIGYLLSSPPGSRNPASDEGSGTVIVVWFFAGYVAAPVAYLTVAAITIKRLFPTGQHRYGWISVLLPIVLLIGLLARFG